MDFNFATVVLNLLVSIAALIGIVILLRKGQPATHTEAPKRSTSSTRYRVI